MFPALTRRITQHFRKLSLTVVAFDLGGEFYIFGHTIQWVLSVWATLIFVEGAGAKVELAKSGI